MDEMMMENERRMKNERRMMMSTDTPKQNKFYNQVNDYLTSKKNDHLRQVQINTYYYKRYKSENQLLYFIMIVCVIIIVIAIIKSRVPFFDDYAYSIIIGIILSFSLMYILYSLWCLVYKDNHNYDEDQYLFNTMKLSDTSDISHNVINNCQ
jgi:hypothetical protein